jgi:hypothetical protein
LRDETELRGAKPYWHEYILFSSRRRAALKAFHRQKRFF